MLQVKTQNFENFTWIDIWQPELTDLNDIAKEYKLDYFQIKDSVEVGHLPKIEHKKYYNFLILRAFTAKTDQKATNVEELSNKIAFFFNNDKIITIHRAHFNFLNSVKPSYKYSEDLLIYFIHKIIQTFEEPVKKLSKQVDEIEQVIFLKGDTQVSLKQLYFQKSETRITRKLLLLSQNVINHIEVSEKNKTALQDVRDSMLSLILGYEEVAEDSQNLLNTYLSVNAQKNNDAMRLLTIFSAFFLPLSFIAGIYGMNFENMPELEQKNGYFITLAVMLIVILVIFQWFKRKRIL